MKKNEAIELVSKYLEKANLEESTLVPIYTNQIKRKIAQYFNHWKYRRRISLLRKIEISEWIKPDSSALDYQVIRKEWIENTKEFWIVPCNSFKFFEDNDLRFGYIGLGPIVVRKETGDMYRTYSTSLDVIEKIRKGEEVDLEDLEARGRKII